MRDTAATAAPRETRASPFARRGLWRRIALFAVVAVAGELSLAIPPGPASVPDTYASIGLLALSGVLLVALPWERLPTWTAVSIPLVYVASVLYLSLAVGGTAPGAGVLVLIPLVFTALHHRRWQSVVVVVAVVCLEVVLSFYPVTESAGVAVRRVLFWGVLGFAVSFAIHGLRARLAKDFEQRQRLYEASAENLGSALALGAAAAQISGNVNPDVVVGSAARLAAEIVSPNPQIRRRAQYMRVRGSTVELTSVHDDAGQGVTASFPLAEHPMLEGVVTSRAPAHGPFDPGMLGPSVRPLVDGLDIAYSIYVPIVVDDRVDGALVVSLRQGEASAALFEQCKAVGRMTELALANALGHQRMQLLATTDALTGTANRRSFEQLIGQLPGRAPYAVLVIDVDGLKDVNDTQGHAAGDALLRDVAKAMMRVMRRGDVLARIGGDEFAMVCLEADDAVATQISRRVLESVRAAGDSGLEPRVSIGFATGTSRATWQAVFEAADAAMYRAKSAGGEQYAAAV